MDLPTFIIGLGVGLLIGFTVAWFWASSITKAKSAAIQNSEAELKNLLAQQAKSHLQTSRETIQSLESELKNLLNSVTEYENSLTPPTEDYSKNTFFGEHASMFLRNSDKKSIKTSVSIHPDNQPKDFANTGSGVFVGSSATETVVIEEKNNK